jgi:hypothetical protein
MLVPIGIKSDACTVGLGRATREDRILVLYSHLYRYYHVVRAPKFRLYLRYTVTVFKS